MADITGTKISELEETTDLAGLYTIGSDRNNQSKKVPLQFVKEAADYANAQGDYAKNIGDTVAGNVGSTDYPVFSESGIYAINDVVRYNDRLYRFTAPHQAGPWTGADVEFTSINDESLRKFTELSLELDSVAGGSRKLSANEVYLDAFRTIDGEIIAMGGYFYTKAIHLRKGDSIAISNVAATPSVAILSEVNSSNAYLDTLIRGTDALLTQEYIASKDIYISICALTDAMQNFTIVLQGVVDEHDKFINTIREEVTDYEEAIPDAEIIQGKYRVFSGEIATHGSYYITRPILLHKGESVSANEVTIATAIGVLAIVDENNNMLSLIAQGTDISSDYEYTASEEVFISISALIDQRQAFTIRRNSTLTELKNITANIPNDGKNIAVLMENVLAHSVGISSSQVISGYYRVITGEIASLSAYFYTTAIKMLKGESITSVSQMSHADAVSVITKVDSSNNFIKVLKAGTDSAEKLDYIFDEDCYISLCGTIDNMPLFRINKSGLSARLDHLEKSSETLTPDSDTHLPAISENPLVSIKRDAGYGAIIRKWGIIGDSLSSGEMQCYGEDSTSPDNYKFVDMYQYSWGQQFARIIGAEAYNFSNGGQTTEGWLNNQGTVHDDSYIGGVGGGDWSIARQPENLKDAYIIALGVNDIAKINLGAYQLGSISHITTYDGSNSDVDDTSKYPQSYCRYYAGIIQRIKSVQPNAKIFCITPMGAVYSVMNKRIAEIVNIYDNCYLIDFDKYLPKGYEVSGFYLNGHLSPMGYMYLAYAVNTYIDWLIRKNGMEFRDTALIGTSYRTDY